MRILAEDTRLRDLITAQAHADYVYMYPPRQAYRPFDEPTNARFTELVSDSLARFDDLNLYVHVPFCRQICRFCNLYAVGGTTHDLDGYVTAVLTEAACYAELTEPKTITTLYLGGGTPSLLPPSSLARLVTELLGLFARDPGRTPGEVALEVDPATVDAERLHRIRAAGINRINLGYQSMVDAEVRGLGRRRAPTAGLGLLTDALAAGFDNVCVDLIYGLAGQTDASWRASMEQVVTIGPPTVCAYALTSRPHTGYDRIGYSTVDGELLYRRYDLADRLLREAGYRRETHVRWVRAGGGYQQKANHWGMRNLLGFGAGSRSYLWGVDYRNGYSLRSRPAALRRYLDLVADGRSPVSDGIIMTADERTHKAAVLNVAALDRPRFRALLGHDPVDRFAAEFASFAEEGLCEVGPDRVRATETGSRYRDLLSQALFSPAVRERVREFSYAE
ncbi:coproporphyrinogen-III oxidase family protein [Actinokineospora enzanensis]|uniref:coproporphyrinogen-III oxidase family protein n=1 Tax=Actinokineospora enzanensis TaxID=155975 RepID=UPI00036A4E8F|nr:coproporphyrinogen-III oxidase family protein [Actinokineospora enzanensis]